MDALEDQQLAELLMWVPCSMSCGKTRRPRSDIRCGRKRTTLYGPIQLCPLDHAMYHKVSKTLNPNAVRSGLFASDPGRGESKYGRHNQSTEPSLPINAAV